MVRKRTIIAIIITIFVISLTNKAWLKFKPVYVDFDINSKGKCNIEVQLDKKDNDKFKKTKISNKTLNLDEAKHAKFTIKKIKFPKRLRIIIFIYDELNPIIIKNIQLNNNVKIDNPDKFKVEGADVSTTDKGLILIPKDNVIVLTYPYTLNIKAENDFQFSLFIILIVLTFLLSYKLTNCMAEFNTLYEKSKIDIVFVSIFFVFLFIPMSNIDIKSQISEQENRTLAKLYPLILEDVNINYKFPKEFENWFNDRFYLRNFFIDVHDSKFRINKNWRTKDVIKGKDNWFFLAWEESISSYTNQNLFTQEELKELAVYLNNVDNFCRRNNKHFYFIIAPDKARIYPEYYPEDIKPLNAELSLSNQITDYLNKNTKVNVIYLKDTLIAHKGKDIIYFKQDTHWNELGAYLGYLKIMEVIKKDYKKINIYIPPNYISKNNAGDLYNMTPKNLIKKDNTLYKVPYTNNDYMCKYNYKLINCYNKNSDINMILSPLPFYLILRNHLKTQNIF